MEHAHYPFSYQAGMRLIKHTPKKKIVVDIKRLFSDHQLTETDTEILNLLCKYQYLNAFLLRTLVGERIGECKSTYINKHLGFLESRGLVERFRLEYIDQNGKTNSTPFIYEACYRTKKIFQQYDKVEPVVAPQTILRRLSFNQFHIFMEHQYGSSLPFSSIKFDGLSDGMYRLLSNGKTISFYAFSLRNTEEWRKEYINRIERLIAHIRENELSTSGIIVICENEMQCLQAEQLRCSIKELKSFSVYYLCDYAALMKGHILEHLIYVRPENNYTSYDIIKIMVDGNIRVNEKLFSINEEKKVEKKEEKKS